MNYNGLRVMTDPHRDSQGQPSQGSKEPGRPILPKIVPFSELTHCGEEIWIENEGQLYRLRRTKQGKLILTK